MFYGYYFVNNKLCYFLTQVMQEYFKEVEEESIRDNFVICYELLDELVDFGYPQTTDAKILQEYITQVFTSGVYYSSI